MSGLALPTAAAVTLMFIATGAAVATAPKTQPAAFSQNATAVTTEMPAVEDSAVALASRERAMEHTLAVARADVAARANRAALVAVGVARTTQRKNLAARAQQVQQAQQARVAKALMAQRAQVAKAQQAEAVQVQQMRRTLQAQEAQQPQAAQTQTARSSSANDWQLPIKSYTVTSGFGFRWGRLHAGEDFAHLGQHRPEPRGRPERRSGRQHRPVDGTAPAPRGAPQWWGSGQSAELARQSQHRPVGTLRYSLEPRG